MPGRGRPLVQADGAPGEHADHGVDVDARVGDPVQQELLVDDVLAVLDQELLDGAAEHLDALAHVAGRLHEVGVHVVREQVAAAHAHRRLAALRNLAQHDAEVRDGVFDGLLKLLEMAAGVLDS